MHADRQSGPEAPAWPSGIRDTVRHHTLVHLTGELDDASLRAVQDLYPWRHVSLCASEIVVWPLGTTWVSHQPEAVVLRGSFDSRDVAAVQAAHPGRTVSQDGDLITVWPLLPGGTGRQTTTDKDAR